MNNELSVTERLNILFDYVSSPNNSDNSSREFSNTIDIKGYEHAISIRDPRIRYSIKKDGQFILFLTMDCNAYCNAWVDPSDDTVVISGNGCNSLSIDKKIMELLV